MKKNILERIDALLESQREGHHIPPSKEGEGEECTCLCCGTAFHGNYCPQCGQSSKTHRLRLSDMASHMVSSLTNLDGQLVHTIRDLFTRPGYMIWDFIKGCRAEYFKPVQMLFFLATIYVLLNMLVKIDTEETIVEGIEMEISEENNAEIQTLLQWFKGIALWVHSNKAISVMAQNLLLILPMKWVFHKTEHGRELNATEYFYALAFIGCMELILAMLIIPVGALFGTDVSSGLSFASTLIYLWTFRQLFEISWWRAIKRSLMLAVLLLLEIVVLIVLVGVIVGIVLEVRKAVGAG